LGEMTQSSAELQGQNAGMRTVPAVGRLLSTEPFQRLINVHPRVDVLRATRKELERLRQASRTSHLVNSDIEVEAIHRRVSVSLVVERRPYYRRVINATGIVLHTGL